MENLLLSEKNNYDIEYILENLDEFFDTIDCILSKSKDDKSLNDETSKCNRIRVPNLSTTSVYHNPQSSATQSELTESALSKLESEHTIITDQYKPFNTQIALNNDKRLIIVRYLLLYYYSRISSMAKRSRLAYIDMCIKACKPVHLTSQNDTHHHSHHSRHDEKIQFYLTSQIFIELLNGLYYLIHNGFKLEAYKAIESISQKGDDELMCDVILICNSIKNSIKFTNSLNNSKNAATSPLSRDSKRQSVESRSVSVMTTYTCSENTVDINAEKTSFRKDKSEKGESHHYDEKSSTIESRFKSFVNRKDNKKEFTNLNNVPKIDDSNAHDAEDVKCL